VLVPSVKTAHASVFSVNFSDPIIPD